MRSNKKISDFVLIFLKRRYIHTSIPQFPKNCCKWPEVDYRNRPFAVCRLPHDRTRHKIKISIKQHIFYISLVWASLGLSKYAEIYPITPMQFIFKKSCIISWIFYMYRFLPNYPEKANQI